MTPALNSDIQCHNVKHRKCSVCDPQVMGLNPSLVETYMYSTKSVHLPQI